MVLDVDTRPRCRGVHVVHKCCLLGVGVTHRAPLNKAPSIVYLLYCCASCIPGITPTIPLLYPINRRGGEAVSWHRIPRRPPSTNLLDHAGIPSSIVLCYLRWLDFIFSLASSLWFLIARGVCILYVLQPCVGIVGYKREKRRNGLLCCYHHP